MRGQNRNETFVLKHRLTGAAILIGFAVILLPMLLGSPENGDSTQNDGGGGDGSKSHVFQSKIQPIGGEVPEDRAAPGSGQDAIRPDTPPPSGDDETQSVVTAIEDESSGESGQTAARAGSDEEPEQSENGDDDGSVERGWIVQIGTFKNQNNVEKLVAKLQSGGFEPATTEVKTGKGAATRVWVGPFRTRVEAARNKTRVKQRTGTEGLIVAYP